MAASFDSVPHHTAAALPQFSGVALDRLINQAVMRSRAELRGRYQHLHVEAMAAPIRVRGELDRLADALAQVLCAASLSAGENGLILLSVNQIAQNVTLTLRAEPGTSMTVTHPHEREADCNWSAVQDLITVHGGTLSMRTSRDATGLEYTIVLPALPGDCATTTQPRAPLIGGPDGPVCRVLVVDDSPDAADSMACLLSIRGHQVYVAYDGSHAYEAALAWSPDIVLLDIELPGMDGIEIARALRAHGADAAPALIALSGHGEQSAYPYADVFDLFLTKPVDPAVLIDAVERHAAQRIAPEFASPA